MTTGTLSRIGEIVEPIRTWNPARSEPDEVFTYIDLSAVDQEAKCIVGAREVPCGEAPSRARQLVATGDVLVSTVRPNLNGVARVPNVLDGATASTGFCVLRPQSSMVDGNYLFHWVKSPQFVQDMVKKATGASYPAVSDRIVFDSCLPLPPLPEQRRIAEILDRADALRAKRRAVLTQLDTLTQAIFLDVFGDPITNPQGWPTIYLQDVLSIPLRNGLSPSNDGKVMAKVLTLSAITGDNFDPTAWKTSPFEFPPPDNQSVDESDFLICRGNGNVRLVGKGYFPPSSMSDITFPDTMIAARISRDKIEAAFLEHIWNSVAVRRQLESLARTTNGTYKVNQTMLEGIRLYHPPLALQREFARRSASIKRVKQVHQESLIQLDALIAALQARAFRGEL